MQIFVKMASGKSTTVSIDDFIVEIYLERVYLKAGVSHDNAIYLFKKYIRTMIKQNEIITNVSKIVIEKLIHELLDYEFDRGFKNGI